MCDPTVMWSIVARFPTVGEAETARTALDAAGIRAQVADENTIAIDWLYSNAVGGVKVLVSEEDLPEASAVLAGTADTTASAVKDLETEPDESRSSTESIEAADTEGERSVARCPSCGSVNVQRVPRLALFCALGLVGVGVGVAVNQPALAGVAIVAVGLIVAATAPFRCRDCGEAWTPADTPERYGRAWPPTANDLVEPRCPRCGSNEFYRYHYRRLKAASLLGMMFIVVLPVWVFLPKRKCDSCGLRLWSW